MKKRISLLLAWMALFLSLSSHGQDLEQQVKHAAEMWESGQFVRAATEFEYLLPFVMEANGANDTTLLPEFLNLLGTACQNTQQYTRAEKYLLQAKSIFENINRTQHVGYTFTLSNLAVLYDEMGDYTQSEPIYLKVLENDRLLFGERDTLVALDLNNLATLYQTMGRYDKVEQSLLLALEIAKENWGENHPEYINYLNNLAQFYRITGQYEQAEPLMARVLELSGKIFPGDNPQYAKYLNNMAQLDFLMGRYAEAEPLFIQALAIARKKGQENTPSYATKLNNLGSLYFATGRYKEAEPMFQQALGIDRMQLGEEHLMYARDLNNLAMLNQSLGKFGEADVLNRKAFAVYQNQIRSNTGFLSARELEQFLNTFTFQLDIYQSSNILQFPRTHATGDFAYDIELNRKGLLLKSAGDIKNRILNSGDSALIRDYENLSVLRKKIGEIPFNAPDEQQHEKQRLQQEANDVEKRLALKSGDFRETIEEGEITWKRVRDRLNPDEAAIEFSGFPYYNGKKITDSILYCAVVLRKADTMPKMVFLTDEKTLGAACPSPGKVKAIDAAYAIPKADPDNPSGSGRGDNNRLYSLLWQPFESLLPGVKTIYYSPTGMINRVSLAAIPINSKQTLSDRYKLIQLSSTRTLATPEETKPASYAVVYGGINYDTLQQPLIARAGNDAPVNAGTDNSLYSGELRSGFGYLPGTFKEAEAITARLTKKGFRTEMYSGKNAPEESFIRLSGASAPSLIHLSTHGFYLPDTISEMNRKSLGNSISGAIQFRYSEDPLLRSGLLMTGANLTWKGLPRPHGTEDGILTAREVSNLNLLNTEVVVLSACQTGLGDVKGSEGVEGLQRGFKMAGARHIIMSLWEVPDRETTEFMTVFYDTWLGGKGIREAFNVTQAQMRNKYRANPFKWAGFVLVE